MKRVLGRLVVGRQNGWIFRAMCSSKADAKSSLQERQFDYGQNSTMHVSGFKGDVNMELETLWEDKSLLCIKDLDLCEVVDQGKDIYIKPSSKTVYPFDIYLKIPEYSNLHAELNSGSVKQNSTPTIDARIKGDFKLIHKGQSPKDEILLQRVKTENCHVEVGAANLTFRKYLQTKRGKIVKKGPGKVEFKMLGVAESLDIDLTDCELVSKSIYTNEPTTEEALPVRINCINGKISTGIFNGSASISLKSSSLQIEEVQARYLQLTADSSSVEIYLRDLTRKLDLTLSNGSKATIRGPKPLLSRLRSLTTASSQSDPSPQHFSIKLSADSTIHYKERDEGENLFGYLLKKYPNKVNGGEKK